MKLPDSLIEEILESNTMAKIALRIAELSEQGVGIHDGENGAYNKVSQEQFKSISTVKRAWSKLGKHFKD